jgi:hypothetical protein
MWLAVDPRSPATCLVLAQWRVDFTPDRQDALNQRLQLEHVMDLSAAEARR